MHGKGLLTRDERAFACLCGRAEQKATQGGLLKDLIRKAFAGSGKALVLAALREGHVSKRDRAEIEALLREESRTSRAGTSGERAAAGRRLGAGHGLAGVSLASLGHPLRHGRAAVADPAAGCAAALRAVLRRAAAVRGDVRRRCGACLSRVAGGGAGGRRVAALVRNVAAVVRHGLAGRRGAGRLARLGRHGVAAAPAARQPALDGRGLASPRRRPGAPHAPAAKVGLRLVRGFARR